MIILRNTTNNKITEMFDTVSEFKDYIRRYLCEIQDGMKEDGLEAFDKDVNTMSWSEILDTYQDMEDEETIEYV